MTDLVGRMHQAAAVATGKAAVAVLIVSRAAEDHDTLRTILLEDKWRLYDASDVPSALRELRRHESISLIVCDCDLWKEILASTAEKPGAPQMIVAARDADAELWAEVLNMGAYDVLAKPFEPTEVVRSLSLGWLYWRRQREHEN